MASIRKRGKTSWEAQVRMRGWETQTRTFTTKADAAQWASEREAEMRRGTFVDTSTLKTWTLGRAIHLAPKRRLRRPLVAVATKFDGGNGIYD